MPSTPFAYLIRMFPQTSETFIANEILRVERTGLPLRLFSYRRPLERVEHECVHAIQTPVHYLPDPLWKSLPAVARALWLSARREPARFRRSLAFCARVMLRDRGIDVWKRLLQACLLAIELRDAGVRHIHAHFAHQNTQVAMLASLLTGISYSFTGHAKDVYTARPAQLRERIEAAAFAVTCTRGNLEYLSGVAGPTLAGKLRLAYHGVDADKFRPASTPPSGRPLVLSVGRLVEKKGFPDLLAALAQLKARGVDFEARIVGGGPERAALLAQVEALGLQDVVALPGACSQEELVPQYQHATVFALPCRVLDNGDRDGLPNVLLEAMACGVPVVSTQVSGIPELVTSGENGLLVQQGDVNGLASALELLLGDAGLRQRLGERALATVRERFSSDATAALLAGLFHQAAALDMQQEAATAPLTAGTALS